MIRATINFTGRVQGVGFRATAHAVARRFDVAGWVRNEPDGSVRCVVEGEHAEIARFVAAVHQAMAGYIDDATTSHSQATGEFRGFSIAR
jgi:acylphosphatase